MVLTGQHCSHDSPVSAVLSYANFDQTRMSTRYAVRGRLVWQSIRVFRPNRVKVLGAAVHEAVRSGRPFQFSARQVSLRPRPRRLVNQGLGGGGAAP